MFQWALIVPGLLLGSLLNLLADDLPHRLRPRVPHCSQCSFPFDRLQWVALVALFSKRWRCARCHAPLPWRRLAVEMASALLLVFVAQRFGFGFKGVLLAALLECLLLITVIDLEHRLILYVTIFPSALVALAYGVWSVELELGAALAKTLIGGLVGFGVFYFFYLLGFVYSAWAARRRGEALDEIAFGGGDANLGGVVGLAVGWPGIVLTLFYAILSGGLVAGLYLGLMSLRRKNMLFAPIPYGPFIVFGGVVILLFAAEIKRFYGVGP